MRLLQHQVALLVLDDSLLRITICEKIFWWAKRGIFYPGSVQPSSDLFTFDGASMITTRVTVLASLSFMAPNWLASWFLNISYFDPTLLGSLLQQEAKLEFLLICWSKKVGQSDFFCKKNSQLFGRILRSVSNRLKARERVFFLNCFFTSFF